MTIFTGTPPPHDIEAERSVLGAILLSAKAVIRPLALEEGLRTEQFFRDSHRAVFGAMLVLDERGDAIDVLTVTAELRRSGKLEEVGGRAAVDDLTGGVPGLGAVRSYSRIVTGHYRSRERLASAYEQVACIANHAPEEEYQAALQRAHVIVAGGSTEGYLDPQDLGSLMFEHLESGPPDEGLPVPPELSSLTTVMRFRIGHTTFLGGWSGMGKTNLAMQLCDTFGHRKLKVGAWSNEDVALELGARQAQRMTGISAVSFIDRTLRGQDLARFTAAMGRLPYGIQPCAGWEATQIATGIRQFRGDVAVVDHLHNIPGLSETRQIDEAMKALVNAARQTPCHLIVLGQLNHERDKTIGRPPPVVRDIRGSALIHDLADNVLFIHRDEEEAIDDNGQRLGRALTHDTGRIDVAKCKAMPGTGLFRVLFDRRRARFIEPARADRVAA